MQKLRLKISNYKAINEADIHLNGITVLAGENGCGKSTISRWLYYLVNSIEKYNDFVFAEYIARISSFVRVCVRLFRLIGEENFNKSHILLLTDFLRKLESYSKFGDSLVSEVYEELEGVIKLFFIDLQKYWNSNISDGEKARIVMYLRRFNDDVDDLNLKNLDIIEECDKFLSEINKSRDIAENKIRFRTKEMLYDIILNNYNEENIPSDLQLKEYEEDIFTDVSFKELSSISKALYIDTPMYLSESFFTTHIGFSVRKMLFNKEAKMNSNCKKILIRIKRILKGNAQLDTDEIGNELYLNYHREDGLVIPIEDTATGFKSFIYLQRFLENGCLDKNTLLIIDEPEAHLHPQWIVEFAKLLVLLNKEVGVKILIASHNSDMVSAIQAIAKYEAILDNVTFYQAVQSDIPYKYNYKNLGQDISEIFKSYNIAIAKISRYE